MAPAPDRFDDTLDVLKIDAKRKRRRGVSWRLVFGGLALAAAVGLGVSRVWTSVAEVDVTRAVRVDPAAPTTSLTAGGYVVAHRKTELGPKITGRIEWIGVERGDSVRRGQILVRLEQRDLQAHVAQARANAQAAEARLQRILAGSRAEEIQEAQAAVDQAQSSMVFAALNLERTDKLFRDGLVARQALDESRNQQEIAQGKLKAAQERLQLLKAGARPEEIDQARAELRQAQAALELAEANLENTLIRAPIDGTILERLAEPGETVTTSIVSQRGAKSAILSMADLQDLQVEVDVNQSDLKRLRLNMPVTVTPEAYPDRTYRGVLVEMAPEANRQKATLQVRIQIVKPDAFVRPEMNARVIFQEPPKQPAGQARVLVPREAVVSRGEARVVHVVADGKVAERRVTLGAESAGQVEVLSGLEGGETLAVAGTTALRDGQAVRPKP